jgi:C4-dicarboxylate transporter DctM subunit
VRGSSTIRACRKRSWTERLKAFRESYLGPAADRDRDGRHLRRHVHADRSGGDERGVRFIVAVFVYKDLTLKDVPKVLLDSANMSAMLLYIITNAVLFSFLMTSEQIPQATGGWMLDSGLGALGFLLVVNILLLLAGNVMEASRRSC